MAPLHKYLFLLCLTMVSIFVPCSDRHFIPTILHWQSGFLCTRRELLPLQTRIGLISCPTTATTYQNSKTVVVSFLSYTQYHGLTYILVYKFLLTAFLTFLKFSTMIVNSELFSHNKGN